MHTTYMSIYDNCKYVLYYNLRTGDDVVCTLLLAWVICCVPVTQLAMGRYKIVPVMGHGFIEVRFYIHTHRFGLTKHSGFVPVAISNHM